MKKQDIRYRVVTQCVQDGCRCEHRKGVIVYEGDDKEYAEKQARLQSEGYKTTLEVIR